MPVAALARTEMAALRGEGTSLGAVEGAPLLPGPPEDASCAAEGD